jgi:hypothetical protein
VSEPDTAAAFERRRRDGWVPVYLPQRPGNERYEWWWRHGVQHELMTPAEAAAAMSNR